MTTLRVVVGDDHPLMRDAVAVRLAGEDDIDVVATAASIAELLEVVETHRPDVAVVDLAMQDGTTLAVFDRLVAASPATRFLVLSASENGTDVGAALAAGARGFLSKSVDAADLAGYVREVASGASVLDTTSATAVARQLRTPSVVLAPREIEILRLVAEGLTNREIARRLYVSLSTVKTQLERAFGKLDVGDRAAAIARAKDLNIL